MKKFIFLLVTLMTLSCLKVTLIDYTNPMNVVSVTKHKELDNTYVIGLESQNHHIAYEGKEAESTLLQNEGLVTFYILWTGLPPYKVGDKVSIRQTVIERASQEQKQEQKQSQTVNIILKDAVNNVNQAIPGDTLDLR